MQIAIKTRLGNVALAIKAALRNDDKAKLEAGKAAAYFAVWHQAGSKVFNKKGFERKASFSDELAIDVKAAVKSVLAEFCDSIEIETSKHIPTDPFTQFSKQMKSLGFDENAIAEMWAKRPAASKAESSEETSTEEIEETPVS